MLYVVVKIRKIEYAQFITVPCRRCYRIRNGGRVVSNIHSPFGSYMTVLHKWNDGFAEANMVTCLIKTQKTLCGRQIDI